jgi:hypothetical protein
MQACNATDVLYNSLIIIKSAMIVVSKEMKKKAKTIELLNSTCIYAIWEIDPLQKTNLFKSSIADIWFLN